MLRLLVRLMMLPLILIPLIVTAALSAAPLLPAGGTLIYEANASDYRMMHLHLLDLTRNVTMLLMRESIPIQPLLPSPDGTRILYYTRTAEGYLVTVQYVRTGETHPITDPLPTVSDLAWLPDGERVSFAALVRGATLPSIYVTNIEDETTERVDTASLAPQAFAWSSRGEQLAFVTGEGALYLMSDDAPVMVTGVRDLNIQWLLWSPDDRWLYYADTGAGGTSNAFRVAPQENAAAEEVGIYQPQSMIFSPVDQRLLVSTGYQGFIMLWDENTGLTRLTHGDNAVWSPDWEQVAIVRYDPRGLGSWLYALNLVTGEERLLLRSPALISQIAWLP